MARRRQSPRPARTHLGDLLRSAHENSRRRVSRGRRSTATLTRFSAGAAAADELEDLRLPARLVRWGLALLLLPLCFVTSLTLFQTVSDPDFFGPFWRSSQFWYFSAGVIITAAWFFAGVCRDRLLYLYVLGHELTHALFVYLSFGKVAEIKVTTEGGYIVTNKSNVLIALSPYFVPFWTAVLFVVIGAVSLLSDVDPIGRGLFFSVGLTWGFHLLWTLWMIPRDQPDLRENDTLFSLVVIYLANIGVVTTLICLATDRVTFSGFAETWLTNGELFTTKAKAIVHQLAAAIRS